MRNSEISGLVTWSLALSLSVFGLVLFGRSRHLRRSSNAQRLGMIVAPLISLALTIASIAVLVEGVRGEYFDDALGSTAWAAGMPVGLAVGLLAGRLVRIAGDPPEDSPIPAAATGSTRERVIRVASMVAIAVGLLVMIGGAAVFMAGDVLFGSDEGTIDSYNREVLDSCKNPEGSTLVRTYTLDEVDISGSRLRSLSYVFASPLPPDEVADFYGLGRVGLSTYVSARRSCKFGNRPWAVVESTSGDFWSADGAEVTDLVDPPAGTRSFLLLRLFQAERDGIFSHGAFDPSASHPRTYPRSREAAV